MPGSGMTFPVNGDAGGESASEWAEAVAPDQVPERNHATWSNGAATPPLHSHSAAQARLRAHLSNVENMV